MARPCPGNTSPQITLRWPGRPKKPEKSLALPPASWQSQAHTGHWLTWGLDTCLPGPQLVSLPTPWLSLSPRALPPLPCTVMPALWQQFLSKCVSLSPPLLQDSLPHASGNHAIPSSGTRVPCPMAPHPSSAWPQPPSPACPLYPSESRPGIKHCLHL